MDTQNDAAIQAEIVKVRSELEALRQRNAAKDAAQKEKTHQLALRERDAAISGALSSVPLTDRLKKVMLKALRDDVTVDDEGTLSAPGGCSVKEYIQQRFAKGGPHENLVKASAALQSDGSAPVDIDSIRPGADNSKAQAEIARLTRELFKT